MKWNELVLSAGGTKGVYFLGSLEILNKEYPLSNFQYLTGCSAGAIICTFLNIGYTIQEIKDIYFSIKFDHFIDIKIMNLIQKNGFSDHHKIRNLLTSILMTKNISPLTTFKDLFDRTKKTLTINSVNISRGSVLYMNHIETPSMKLIDGLLMTMNIPVFFPSIEYHGELFVDGAILDPFPYYYNKNTKKLGLIIVDDDLYKIFNNDKLREVENNFVSNFSRIIQLIYNHYLKNFYKRKFKDTIYFQNDHTLNLFEINDEQKNKFYTIGQHKINLFLRKNFRKYQKLFTLKKYFSLLRYLLIKDSS